MFGEVTFPAHIRLPGLGEVRGPEPRPSDLEPVPFLLPTRASRKGREAAYTVP